MIQQASPAILRSSAAPTTSLVAVNPNDRLLGSLCVRRPDRSEYWAIVTKSATAAGGAAPDCAALVATGIDAVFRLTRPAARPPSVFGMRRADHITSSWIVSGFHCITSGNLALHWDGKRIGSPPEKKMMINLHSFFARACLRVQVSYGGFLWEKMSGNHQWNNCSIFAYLHQIFQNSLLHKKKLTLENLLLAIFLSGQFWDF